MAQKINRLTPLEVANAKVGMHADGGGLYLQVTKTVAGQLNKSWLFRYSVGGRDRQMGLGSLTEVKLAEAREKAVECRRQRLDGASRSALRHHRGSEHSSCQRRQHHCQPQRQQ